MSFTAWKPTNSEHVLPLEQDASLIQIQHVLNLELFIDYLMAALQSVGIGAFTGVPVIGQTLVEQDYIYHWIYELRDPGDVVIFRQEVELKFMLLSLVESVFGIFNMSFFLYNFTKQTITTTVVDGQEVDPALAWRYTWPREFATPNTEQGYMEHGGGGSYTDKTAFIQDAWFSPVYEFNVPVGTTLHVTMDSAGSGITSRPEWLFRFDEAAIIGALLDRQGAVRTAIPFSNRVYLKHTYRGPAERSTRGSIPLSSAAFPMKATTNRMYWLVYQSRQWGLWYDDLDGLFPQRLLIDKYSLPAGADPNLVGQPVIFWQDTYKNPSIAMRRDAGFVSCAALGDSLYFRSSSGEADLSDIKQVGAHDSRPCAILVGSTADGTERFEITDGYGIHYESVDGGLSWTALE